MKSPSEAPPRASRVLLTGAALLLIAAGSFGASFLHSGRAALPLALSFSLLKAALVLGVFMEFWRERASVKLAALSAVLLVAVLVGFMLADVVTRDERCLPLPAPRAQR